MRGPEDRARRPGRAARHLVAVAGVAVLAGCSNVISTIVNPFPSSSSTSAVSTGSAVACPTTTILRPLANTAVFGPSAAVPRKPIDVAFYGLLSEVEAKCQQAGPNGLRVSLDTIIAGERGPSARGDSVELTYFVAVTGADQSVISKKNFGIRIDIPPNAKRAAVSDHIDEAISLGSRSTADVSILLGFQQPPDIVEFYRNYRGR